VKKQFTLNPKIMQAIEAGNIESALSMSIYNDHIEKQSDKPYDFFFSDNKQEAAIAGLTLLDFLSDIAKIDDFALQGIDFASKEDLSSIFKFSHYVGENYYQMINAGSLTRLQGYVAENIVAHDLTMMGHIIDSAQTPNQPGWDLIVDGIPFNIKNVNSLEAIKDHFEKYPYIPVITNHDIVSQAHDQGLENVFSTPNLDYDETIDLTKETIEAGHDAAHFPVPWISLGVESAFNSLLLLRGETDLSNAMINISTNAGGRFLGSLVGEEVVAGIGLILFGPAGALIGSGVGGVLGGLFGKKLGVLSREKIVEKRYREAAINALSNLFSSVALAGDKRANIWQEKADKIVGSLSKAKNAEALKEPIMTIYMDDYHYFFDKVLLVSKNTKDPSQTFFTEDIVELINRSLVLIKQTGVHPAQYQNEIKPVLTILKNIYEDTKKLLLH